MGNIKKSKWMYRKLFPIGSLLALLLLLVPHCSEKGFGLIAAEGDILFSDEAIDPELAKIMRDDLKVIDDKCRFIDKLLRDSGEQEILDFSFWEKTCGARSRDPLFLHPGHRLMFDEDGIFCNFFFNMSNRLPVTPNIVLSVETLDLLDQFASFAHSFSNTEVGGFQTLFKTLPYVRKMTVQERRIGALLSAGFSKKRFSFQIDLPILFVERNFWLENKKERKELQDIITNLEGVGKASVIKTSFGLGDTRLKFGYTIAKSPLIKSVAGIQVIVPTSMFCLRKPHYTLRSKPGESRNELITDLLNVGKDILIDPKPGTGHWGVGSFFQFKFGLIKNHLDFWSRFSFDYMFKGKEYRFMPSKNMVNLDVLQQLVTSDTIPEGFPVSDLFPYLVKASVKPGHFFNGAIGLDWKITNNWKWGIGYDYYLQGAESITGATAENIDSSKLLLDYAIDSRVVQHKIFSELSYCKRGKRRDWHFGLGGDMTISAEGTSRDWTAHAKIGITF